MEETALNAMYSVPLRDDPEELKKKKLHYDLTTAVTFLIAGMGVGYICALLSVPSHSREKNSISQSRT